MGFDHIAEYILVLLLPVSVTDETRALPIVSPRGRVMLEWDEVRLIGLRSKDGQWKSTNDRDVNVFCRVVEKLNSRGTWRVI